jgi:hypothetical protein
MPRLTVNKKTFVCTHCNRNFRSNAGRTRHMNAKHIGLPIRINSPHSAEIDHNFSKVSSHPGFLSSPAPPSHRDVLDRSDAPNLSENDFHLGDGDTDVDPPLSPSRDMFTEYHPYLNGKTDNIQPHP